MPAATSRRSCSRSVVESCVRGLRRGAPACSASATPSATQLPAHACFLPVSPEALQASLPRVRRPAPGNVGKTPDRPHARPARGAAPRSPTSRAARACPRPRSRSPSTTGRASRRRRASGSSRRRASWAGGRRRSARALTEARTRAIGLVLARDVGAARGRRVLRALPVRDRADADAPPTTRCCCSSCRRGVRGAARLRAARRGGARGRLPAHRRRGSATRASRCSRPPAMPGRARRAPGGAVPVPVAGDAPRRGDRRRRSRTSSSSGHERIGFLGGRRGRTSTCRCGWRAGASAWRGRAARTAPVAHVDDDARAAALALLRRRRRPRSCARATRSRWPIVPRRALARAARARGPLGDRLRRLAAGRARLARADLRAGRLRGVRRGRRGARCWRRSPASRRRTTRRRRRSWSCAPRPRCARGAGRPRTPTSAATTSPAATGPTTSIACSATVAEEVDRRARCSPPRRCRRARSRTGTSASDMLVHARPATRTRSAGPRPSGRGRRPSGRAWRRTARRARAP